MPQVRYTTEQIIHKLREIDVIVSQGASVKQACRQSEISDKTYYKWRKVCFSLFAVDCKTAVLAWIKPNDSRRWSGKMLV